MTMLSSNGKVLKVGGGGISNKIHQDFVYKNILGKMYKCVEISDKVFFPLRNLDYIDENIVQTNDFEQDSEVAACAYYDYAQTSDYGFLYNRVARGYIRTIKTSQMKYISRTYFDLLINYIKNLIENWLGKNTHPSNTLLTTFTKNSDFDNYEDWLGLIDIGLGVSGYWYINFSKTPYGYYKPVYFGITTQTSSGEMINIEEGKTLAYFNGLLGDDYCYPMRFFIDEN